MWPPEVERVAAFLRAAGVEGRLEELAPDEADPPGPAIRVEAYDCDGRAVVAIVPVERELDRDKLAAVMRCVAVRRTDPPSFPYSTASVLIDRLVFADPAVWIDAGSARYTASLAPTQLAELTRAQSVDLVVDS